MHEEVLREDREARYTFMVFPEDRPRVRDVTLETNDIFVSYSISPKPIKLSFETE